MAGEDESSSRHQYLILLKKNYFCCPTLQRRSLFHFRITHDCHIAWMPNISFENFRKFIFFLWFLLFFHRRGDDVAIMSDTTDFGGLFAPPHHDCLPHTVSAKRPRNPSFFNLKKFVRWWFLTFFFIVPGIFLEFSFKKQENNNNYDNHFTH